MKTQTLEQRVVASLTADDPPKLDQLLTLIADVEAAIIEADNTAEIARAEFFDPIQTPDIHTARDRMEATQFVAERLRSLLPRIQQKAREAECEADRQEWLIDFAALAEQRNALAKELRELYPRVEAQLVSLFARIAANDSALSAVHGSRPDGAKGFLLGAEQVARGLDAFTRDEPSITRELQIPSWTKSCRLSWPARELPAAVMLAEAMPTSDPRRHSDHWFEALKEDSDRRRAEEANRIAAEDARQQAAKREYEKSLPR